MDSPFLTAVWKVSTSVAGKWTTAAFEMSDWFAGIFTGSVRLILNVKSWTAGEFPKVSGRPDAQLRRPATDACAACNRAASAVSLDTMVFPTGAKASSANLRC